jgi:predicted amidophosphoribosyltransferase
MTNPIHPRLTLADLGIVPVEPPPVVFTPPLVYTPGVCDECNRPAPVLTDPRMDGEGCCERCVAQLAADMREASSYEPKVYYPYRQY